MDSVPQSAGQCSNRILSLLPEGEYQALLPALEFVETPLHFQVCERDQPIEYAYFPLSGEHSIVVTLIEGAAVEVGTVGYEGFSTVDLLLGANSATETIVCEIPGAALRMPTAHFKQCIEKDTQLRRLCLRYLQAYLAQVSQSVACNRFHAVEHRMARWLLMSHDRVQKDEFCLTQEYLATMLGVHRPSVTVAAGALQRAGFIKYTRGKVQILDREGLEGAACECYAVVKGYFEKILGVSG